MKLHASWSNLVKLLSTGSTPEVQFLAGVGLFSSDYATGWTIEEIFFFSTLALEHTSLLSKWYLVLLPWK
jgi:hypothetical protein